MWNQHRLADGTGGTCRDSGCLIPQLKTKLRVLNIVDTASEMHIAIQNLIVRRWDRWKTMPGTCDKWGEFLTMSDELTNAKEQLRMASPAERKMREMLMRIGGDDPDERSKHGVPRQQDLTQQQPPTESPPQKQRVPPQSSWQPFKQQSRKNPRQQQFHPEPGPHHSRHHDSSNAR